jgi:hypothetical protein
MYNIRVLRNYCIDGAAQALSSQTLYGGPVYFIRNIIYHGSNTGFIKHANHPSGSIYYHNTAIANVNAGAGSNNHFRNNLILNWMPEVPVFSVDTFSNYTSSDYNGFRPSPDAEYSFGWNSSQFNVLKDYKNPGEKRKYKSLAEYSGATGQDEHSILVDYDIFERVHPPVYPDEITKIFNAEDMDFRIKPGSAAVDAACILPNVNDNFSGDAPDLGALESGLPVPHYGPRY